MAESKDSTNNLFKDLRKEIELDIDTLRALLASDKKGKVRIPVNIYLAKNHEEK